MLETHRDSITRGRSLAAIRYPDDADAEMEPNFEEVWIEAPDGQSMCALINDARGWLMYLRWEGDAGFSSRNPEFRGDPDAKVEYRLNNGQRDWYPEAWALPLADVRRALDYFARERQRPPFVLWHED